MVAGGFSVLAIYLELNGGGGGCVGGDGGDQRIFLGLKFDFWQVFFWVALFE